MIARLSALKDRAWPTGGLERVSDGPLCGSRSRTLLHEDLSDQVFFVAPGQWTLWRCAECRSAYLDPRPNEETIGLAYGDYYTHRQEERPSPQTAFQRLRLTLANGYRNALYGTRLAPASAAGYLLARLLPPMGRPVDAAFRYLPKRRVGQKQRVLDIGCGNGDWLALIEATGWEAAGVEPDPVAAARARDRGFEVRSSVEDWLDRPGSFDFVATSQVIEHVHDPLALLRGSYALLRPGGRLYIDTPNIDSLGHDVHGRNWVSLDPPRHLILFTRDSLAEVVTKAGFRDIRFRPPVDAFRKTSLESRRIEAGLDPFADQSSSKLSQRAGLATFLRAKLARTSGESLSLTAIKPVS